MTDQATSPQDPARVRRAQRQLLLIAVLFLTPFVAAVVMRFSGWEPPRTRNHGELLAPPLPMQAVSATQDGVAWVFENTDRQWSLLLQQPATCDARCRDAIAPLANVHVALGRHADKLHPFRIDDGDASGWPRLTLSGELPTPLRDAPAALPQVWLVDPHGFLVMRYPEGFDPSGLRKDLGRLVK